MIFATVGMQLPFPRMVRALDDIAGQRGLNIVVQTIENVPGLKHVEQRASLTPCEFDALAKDARAIVGHAGIGTIISAERFNKPIVLFPRIAALGEHRNEHQLATVRNFEDREGIFVAKTEQELERLLVEQELVPFRAEAGEANALLQQRIANFISDAGGSPWRRRRRAAAMKIADFARRAAVF